MNTEELFDETVEPSDLFKKESQEYLSDYRIGGDGWYIESLDVIPAEYCNRRINSDYKVELEIYFNVELGEVRIRADNQSIELKQEWYDDTFETKQFEEESYENIEQLCETVTGMLHRFKEQYHEQIETN